MNRNRKGCVIGTSLHGAKSKGNKSAFKHGDGTWGGSKTKPEHQFKKEMSIEEVANLFSEKAGKKTK